MSLGIALGYKGEPKSARKQFGPFHDRMLEHVHSQPKTSTIVPRGHAKSTVITVIDTVHHLLHHPESRNLIACATLDLARKLVGEIRDGNRVRATNSTSPDAPGRAVNPPSSPPQSNPTSRATTPPAP